MKRQLSVLMSVVLTGVFFLSGCAAKPKEPEGPHEVPLTITADLTKTGDGSNWVTYGECKVVLEDGKAVLQDRATSNSGIAIPCADYRGNTVSATAKVSSANSFVRLSLKYEIYGNTSYVTIAEGETTESSVATISGNIEIPDNAENAMVYIEAGDVRDITVSSFELAIVGDLNNLTGVPIESLADPSATASLSAAYKDYFKFGVASPASVMTNTNEEFRTLLKTQFNSVTPENELKPENVLDAATTLADPGKYNECPALNFDAAKPILDFCKDNGIPMRGHTLIWYSQTPSWLFYENYDVNGELASRELMLTRMENYIAAVMTWCEENYPGVIYAWDVVNEAIADDGGMRDCYWLETIGEDYVEKAFEFARKHAPEGVQLFYNDYNEYQDSKQADIIEMLKPVAEAGNIDGMGMQSHISSGLDPDYYLGAMQEYVDELGVIIHITELDVTAPNSQNPMYDQGVYMQKLFTAIIEAKDAGMPIECVTVWGLTDDMSWKSASSPLLFYGNLDPKPAYEGVMCAINGGEVAKPADYVEPKSDLSPIEEDYENKEYIGGPRYSAVQTIVGDAFEGEYCLMNSEGYAEYDGYSIDISNYIGHTIHVSFAVKCAADQVCLTADIDGTWPHLAEVSTGTDEWIEVECDYQVPDDNTSLSIYFESSDMTEFYLDNLKIEAVD